MTQRLVEALELLEPIDVALTPKEACRSKGLTGPTQETRDALRAYNKLLVAYKPVRHIPSSTKGVPPLEFLP